MVEQRCEYCNPILWQTKRNKKISQPALHFSEGWIYISDRMENVFAFALNLDNFSSTITNISLCHVATYETLGHIFTAALRDGDDS